MWRGVALRGGVGVEARASRLRSPEMKMEERPRPCQYLGVRRGGRGVVLRGGVGVEARASSLRRPEM